MKNFQQFVNEGIVPKKKKGTKKTFIPVILPKSVIENPPIQEVEDDLDQIDPNIPIPRVKVR